MFNNKFDNDMDELESYFCGGACDVKVYQDMDVCLPITVEPYVNMREAEVECIDEPYIVKNPNYMKGKNAVCRFNLAQKICIMIPIEFRAKTTNGPISVICGKLTGAECSADTCSEEK